MSSIVEGTNGITAEVIAHSKSSVNGKEVATLKVKYGLIVHAEFLRHRLISNSVKSNRAIPMKNIRKEVINDPYVPVWFGAAQKGMVANAEMKHKKLGRALWLGARYFMCGVHWLAEKLGAHKEWANRMLNPWQFVRETITATEWQNLYTLRLDKAAQKDIQELVKCIKQALENSAPEVISPGEYHTPYIRHMKDFSGKVLYTTSSEETPKHYEFISIEEAIKSSAARCARSSYDKHDNTSSKLYEDVDLYNTLLVEAPVHASPAEHICTPMKVPEIHWFAKELPLEWEEGVSHIDKGGEFWSGNFKGWVQHRKTIENEAVW